MDASGLLKSILMVFLFTLSVLSAVPALAQVREFGVEEAPKTDNPIPEAEEKDPVVAQLQALDLRERVAQLMLVTTEGGPSANSSDRALLRQYSPGGVVIPTVLTPGTAADYVSGVRGNAMEGTHGIPLLVGTSLSDLPKHWKGDEQFFAPLPSLMALSAAGDPDATRRYASFIAEHLKLMGFNFHLGPSLELAPVLPDAKGGVECLGSDPGFVGTTGAAIFEVLAEQGILAMPMGFPGGGWNREGKGPAVLLTPGAQVMEKDLLPFVRAIESGVPMIHVGNTLTPTLDAAIPASLSRVVMQDLLRVKLGFKGVIVAGPMDEPDIARLRDPSEAAVAALHAGADMIYWRQAGQRVMKSVDEIVQAVQSGVVSQDVIDAALTRVLRMKQEYGLLEREPPEAKDSDRELRRKRQQEEVFYVERRSITLVQNRNNVLPLTKQGSQPIAVTGVVGVDELQKELEEYLKPIAQQPIVTARHGGEIYDFEIRRVTQNTHGARTVICTLTPELRKAGQVELIQRLKEDGANVVVVLIGYPQSLADVALADAIVLSYSDPKRCEMSMKAVAEALAGEGAVSILPLAADVKTQVGKEEVFTVFDIIRSPAGRLPVAVESQFPAGLAVAYDPRTTLKKVVWDFGDGSRAKDATTKKVFKNPGRYPVTLTVVDQSGEETSRTIQVDVE